MIADAGSHGSGQQGAKENDATLQLVDLCAQLSYGHYQGARRLLNELLRGLDEGGDLPEADRDDWRMVFAHLLQYTRAIYLPPRGS